MSPIRELIALEWRLTRRNRLAVLLFVLFPLVGLALPSVMVFTASRMLVSAQNGELPGMSGVLSMVQTLAAMSQIDLAEAARILLLRTSAAFYILVPALILPITAAFAVVGERTRRTLEPVLATPILDHQFCLGKLLATVLPAVLASWAAAIAGAALAALLVHLDHGVWLWPDALWWLAVSLLTPLLGTLVGLSCLWVSVRARDAQAAAQISAVVLTPLIVLLLSLVGPFMVIDAAAVLWTGLATAGVDAVLLAGVLRSFGRAGLLGAS